MTKSGSRPRRSGFPSGTPAKVNLYREFRETAADVIQSLPARVENDQIIVEWKYDYLSSEARKNETGVARFIAEVELDGGKHWAKSALALELELRTIKTLEWSTARIEAEETAEITIETLGFPDDTEVRLELWRFGWNASKKVGDFRPLQLAGGTASARCPYAPAGAAELAITRSGEYFVIAKITGAVSRTARSSLLWCVYAEQDATQFSAPVLTHPPNPSPHASLRRTNRTGTTHRSHAGNHARLLVAAARLAGSGGEALHRNALPE